MRKIKSYVIDLYNEGRYAFKGHSQTQNADFWTSDTDAWLRFKIATQSVVISSAQINLYNKNDRSLVIEQDMTIVNNEAEFKMSETLIEHFGHWSAQVIFIIGGKKHTSPTIEFTVSRELGADLPERLGLIEDWKNLNDEVKSFVAEIEGFTLDQFVELKMGEELQNLEANYAVKLTELQTNDNTITAQLAQKANQNDLDQTNWGLNGTNKRIDSLIIPLSPENSNIEVTNAKTSLTKNKTFDTLGERFEDLESETLSRPMVNVLKNGDFSSDQSWKFVNAAGVVENGQAKFTPTTTHGRLDQSVSVIQGHIYYVSALVKSTITSVYVSIAGTTKMRHSGSGNFENLSTNINWTGNSGDFPFQIRNESTTLWPEVTVDNALMIDLTETFGMGNEPSKEFIDDMIKSEAGGWFDGKMNTVLYDYVKKDDITNPLAKPFENKKILILGDSITAIGISDRGWLKYFSDIVKPSALINTAVSGATWCDKVDTPSYTGILTEQASLNVIGNQVQYVLDSDIDAPDVIMIAAGINDAFSPATATMTDDQIEAEFYGDGVNPVLPLENADRTNYAGAMRYAVEKLRDKYPDSKIFINTLLQRAATPSNYYDNVIAKRRTMIKICERLSVEYIDTFMSGVYSLSGIHGQAVGDYNDGLHLSVTGAKKVGTYNAVKFAGWFEYV